MANIYIAMCPIMNGRWAYMLDDREYTRQEFFDKADELRAAWRGVEGDTANSYNERFRATVPSWTFVKDGTYSYTPRMGPDLESASSYINGEERGYIFELDPDSQTVTVYNGGNE